jgi:outer membrane protein OmpA-like peptidoglycan-associated protein
MRRPALLSCAALASLALTALPSTAAAQHIQPWTFRLEAGAGTTIRDFDHDGVNTDTIVVAGTARVAVNLFSSPFALQLGGAFGRFFRDPAFGNSLALLTLNAGVRFEPMLGDVGRLWFDVNAGAALPGTVTSPGLDAGLGFEFQVTRGVSFGPYGRFGYIWNGRNAVPSIAANAGQPSLSLSQASPDVSYWHAGLTLAFRGVADPVVIPPPPVPTDRDHDGVTDPTDLCADQPRGDHPDPARLGCPSADADGDGVFDPDDQCVSVPAGAHPDAARAGCPTPDTDGDGVLDPQDQCVNEPAGEHPNPERAGCPDGDGDHDGVFDHADQCPTEPVGLHADPARAGCPAPDRDHDSVPDLTDHCPDRPGAPSADPMRNGCPGLVLVDGGQIRINRPVFFAPNHDVVLRTSFPVLTAMADALAATPEIRHISVEGHTDDIGEEATNLDLSRRRAASVVAWLTGHGIDAARLASTGFGETRPVTPGTTGAIRARNRRVEFRIVADSEVAAPAPAATSP